MHESCFNFVRRVKATAPAFFDSGRILEVGSLDVNNTQQEMEVRPLFAPCCEVIGVDKQAGAGVDVVCDGVKLPFDDASFDVVYSTETFEHAAEWRKILIEMHRVAKPGALLFVTAATTGRPVHGRDEWGFGYYKNVLPSALRAQIRGNLLMFEEQYGDVCDVRAAWVR